MSLSETLSSAGIEVKTLKATENLTLTTNGIFVVSGALSGFYSPKASNEDPDQTIFMGLGTDTELILNGNVGDHYVGTIYSFVDSEYVEIDSLRDPHLIKIHELLGFDILETIDKWRVKTTDRIVNTHFDDGRDGFIRILKEVIESVGTQAQNGLNVRMPRRHLFKMANVSRRHGARIFNSLVKEDLLNSARLKHFWINAKVQYEQIGCP